MHVPDQIDLKIIALMNADGRMSSADIARHLDGVPARTVNRRIEKLVEQDVITIRAVVNPAAFGYKVRADVLIDVEPGHVRMVARKVAEFEQVSYVACATGERDVSVQVVAASNEDLFDFVADQLGNIPGVRRTQTHVLPLRIKDIDSWLPPASVAARSADKGDGAPE